MQIRQDLTKKKAGRAHWCVTWVISGKKKRKFFTTKQDAALFASEEKDKLKLLGTHHAYDADTIALWAKLAKRASDAGTTLTFCVDGWIDHLGKVTRVTSLKNAIKLHLATIDNLSTRQGRKNKLNRLLEAYPTAQVDRAAEDIIAFMDGLRGQLGEKTIDNYKREISSFLSWCKKRDMIAVNRLLGLDDYDFVDDRDTDYLTVSEVKKVLQYVMSDFDIYAASRVILSLFTGIRPEEILKRVDGGWEHLTWKDVYHKSGVYVSPVMAKAMKKKKIKQRYIPRNKTLTAWLAWLQKQNGAPLTGNVLPTSYSLSKWRDKHEDLVAIMKHRRGSYIRHTFATYSFETTDSKATTARILGNSETVLENFYLSSDDGLKKAAEAFWNLTPDNILNENEKLKVI